MEIEKIVMAIFVTLIFGFAIFAYIGDFSKDASVNLDKNYTRLSSGFEDNLQDMNDLGERMVGTSEDKGGQEETSAGSILIKGMYTVAKMPLIVVKLTSGLLSDAADIIAIPPIYVGAAFSMILIAFVFGLISLLFRKDI